ncbi:cadmium-translocating P-type ATPase [Mesorhizobium sp. BR1-1-16]|uniref:heavy metal translocating P-type ATPase n=1 Tax=Mesorhizobium sp. BR1-1-16 TaxID=2876653 RepID=UPI001CCECEA7|nr:heavy metal translocating P-type ATPase [Mesorhizobium sp. BR1-1-16]MBZ9936805.1 cadmium-translocating P-type ATPase [Mesorhizobium sp. BR1-1-16]
MPASAIMATPVIAAAEPVSDDAEALLALSRAAGSAARQIEFAVPDAYCVTCINAIETGLGRLPQVVSARVNLSQRWVRVVFAPEKGSVLDLPRAIRASGYRTHALDPVADGRQDQALHELIRCMAVAGFAAGNIMLFSVSIWSGADAATRDMFHWISALIALPAIAYAGRPFFRSAFAALRVGRTNMDVPISIGVVLATLLSLWETIHSGAHAYFDASTMLLFFLLVGRTFDHLMREKARGAIANLARLTPRGVTRWLADGTTAYVAAEDVTPGMLLLLRAGERVPVDCRIVEGAGDVDLSIVTGESMAVAVGPGASLAAGAINLRAVLKVEAERTASDSFLSQMAILMETAEASRTTHRRIADRAASIYAPAVHASALLTLLGWGFFVGDWHAAMLNAVAVLIITCPCALALAVPVVHAVAAGRLFRNGIMMRDGTALERAAAVTDIAFDKTGTLTVGAVRYVGQASGDPAMLPIAASLARHSQHPLAVALSAAAPAAPLVVEEVSEAAGQGMQARADGATWRLGSAPFCGGIDIDGDDRGAGTEVCLGRGGAVVAVFSFADAIRPDAASAVAELEHGCKGVRMLSGDGPQAVRAVAEALGIRRHAARLSPEAKLADLQAEAAAGRRVMMVGDGINDAPALRAAHVSMAPSSASDIGRSAADFVFTNGRLASVPFVLGIARRADRLVRENLVLAIGYNALALPLAVTGHVTPLVAAVAMSTSSILVVANALRLDFGTNLVPREEPVPGNVRVEAVRS